MSPKAPAFQTVERPPGSRPGGCCSIRARGTSAAVTSERELAALAIALGARRVPQWSRAEEQLARRLPSVSRGDVAKTRRQISAGLDVLGDGFCTLRSPAQRRPQGATYTPKRIIRAMVAWAASYGTPERVVDAGAGSGRFLVAAGRRFRDATLTGIELDPLAALLARANVAVAGLTDRTEILVGDYRDHDLPPVDGRTLYIGNPPYVRHHQLEQAWKEWLSTTASARGLEASQLAGLHVHFFLATAVKAKKGDFGAFITAAEWLDVNYGRLVRELFLAELGGQGITVIEPTANPFPDAATTAAITYFDVGSRPKSVRLKRVSKIEDLDLPNGGNRVRRERLENAPRWTPLTRAIRKPPEGRPSRSSSDP